MHVTYIEPFGIHITEPFTWLTNWTVAGFSMFFGHKLFHHPTSDIQRKYWSIFFLFMGIASLTGGTAHGFIVYVGNNFHLAAWILTGFAVFGAEMASIPLVPQLRLQSILKLLAYMELFVMAASVLLYKSFDSVQINSAFGMVGIVAPIQLWKYKADKSIRNAIILAGIISNIVPAIIHAARFSYNRWFNFNDLSHVVMIGCFYLIYRGVRTSDLPLSSVVKPTRPSN